MKKLISTFITVILLFSFKTSVSGEEFGYKSQGDLAPSQGYSHRNRIARNSSGDLSPSQGGVRQNNYSTPPQTQNQVPDGNEEPDFSRTTSSGLGVNRYALVIGQDAYRSRPLTTCVNDAKNMKQMLQQSMGFKPENILLYLDRQVTKNRFEQAVREIARKAGPNDLVVIYYSGHGVRRGNQRAILLTTQEYIHTSEFTAWVSPMQAKTLVILDSCYAGGMYNPRIQNQMAAELKDTRQSFQPIRQNRNIFFLASSTENQISMTVRAVGMSRFTYFLLKSLVNGNGDVNRDNRLTLQEIYHWTRRETINHGLRFGNRHDPVLLASNPESVVVTAINTSRPQIVRRELPRDQIARRSAQPEDEAARTVRAPGRASGSATIGGWLTRSAPVGDLSPADRHQWGGNEK